MTSADPSAGNLGYWCSASAARFPDKVALIDLSRDRPRETTYAELERRLDRVAAMLTRLGLNRGDRFAMSIGNCIEFVEIMFGAMRAGIVPVPLNTKLGPDTLRYVIEDSGSAGAAVELAANPHVADIVDSLGLDVRLLLDGAGRAGSGTRTRSPRAGPTSRRRRLATIISPSCPIPQAPPASPKALP